MSFEVIFHTDFSFTEREILELAEELTNLLPIEFQKKQVNLVFVDAERMQELNKSYRNKNKPTDILSFPLDEGEGELVFSVEILEQQALAHEHTLKHELAYMILHGLLHLEGYDHETDQQAKEMFAIQDQAFHAWCENKAKSFA